jgi:hypothetical protein
MVAGMVMPIAAKPFITQPPAHTTSNSTTIALSALNSRAASVSVCATRPSTSSATGVGAAPGDGEPVMP